MYHYKIRYAVDGIVFYKGVEIGILMENADLNWVFTMKSIVNAVIGGEQVYTCSSKAKCRKLIESIDYSVMFDNK